MIHCVVGVGDTVDDPLVASCCRSLVPGWVRLMATMAHPSEQQAEANQVRASLGQLAATGVPQRRARLQL